MTWSIIARDELTGQFGIAVATRFFAVGARVPHIAAGIGGIATHTGRDCVDWCGHVEGSGFSIAGNMLAGARVLDDTAQAYAANERRPFAQRLIAAMRAGEVAGGDKRGKQSAALLIYGDEEWSDLDLRV